jgi:hypothetical protein
MQNNKTFCIIDLFFDSTMDPFCVAILYKAATFIHIIQHTYTANVLEVRLGLGMYSTTMELTATNFLVLCPLYVEAVFEINENNNTTINI